MLPHILPLIPRHTIYTECFAGGLAVFFAKEKAKTEIINDINAFIPNFYNMLVNDFDNLKKKIDGTPYSRAMYKVALVMYKTPHLFNDLQKGWAFFILTNQGFSGQIGSFGCYSLGTKSAWWVKQKKLLTPELKERFDGVQIECTDALNILKLRDKEGLSFHFIDPPYFNSDCGHYGNYTEKDFKDLLELLSTMKGKFLLSSYPSDILSEYTKMNGWTTKIIEAKVSASHTKDGKQKKKYEVLTYNYTFENE